MLQYKTDQEIFDQGLNHILKQGKPSIKNDKCKYRDGEGSSCIIGCMIPDDLYDKKFEGKSVLALFNQPDFMKALERARIGESHTRGKLALWSNTCLLTEMQKCHDRASDKDDFIAEFKTQMSDLAISFGLKFNPTGNKDDAV